jgi:hypothetical protein
MGNQARRILRRLVHKHVAHPPMEHTMSRRTIHSDPGDEQTHLFAPETTMPKTCERRCPNTNTCQWTTDRHYHGIDAKQPRTCLLRYDPAEGVIPF